MIRIYPFPFTRLALATVVLALALSACDTSTPSDDPEVAQVAAEEAADVVASALADTDGGLVASLQDMTAAISHDGMGDARVVQVGHDRQRDWDRARHRACRGGGVVLTYDDESGTHLLQYQCGVETDSLAKSLEARLAYRFRTADGAFIARPWNNWDAVDSVGFRGEKAGSLKKVRGDASFESTFEQTGTWTLSSLAGDGPALLAGTQTREGTRKKVTANGTSTKAFSVTMSSDDIQIRNGDDGLTRSVTGTVEYVAFVEIETPRKSETREVRGTIELDGSGHALLRVFGLRNVYRISLHDGDRTAA